MQEREKEPGYAGIEKEREKGFASDIERTLPLF